MTQILRVSRAPEDAGAFRSIGEALLFAERHPEKNHVIEIAPGIYREHLEVRTGGLTLRGLPGRERDTVITGDLGAYEILEDGLKRGTFRTHTVLIAADDVRLENLTIENTAGPGRLKGQAVALCAYADRLRFYRLRLIGQQDTLFTGPLPEREIEPGGFRGPVEHFPRTLCRMYFEECYIEGNIDFIFGGACAWFERCGIFCRDSGQGSVPAAYVTAPSTPKGQPFGYVLNRCRLISDCPPGSCYLGRPWRDDARCVYLRCSFGAHIRGELWDDWGKPGARENCFFAVYGCRRQGEDADLAEDAAPGPGGDSFENAAPFSRILTDEEAQAYTPENVLQITEWGGGPANCE